MAVVHMLARTPGLVSSCGRRVSEGVTHGAAHQRRVRRELRHLRRSVRTEIEEEKNSSSAEARPSGPERLHACAVTGSSSKE